MLQNGFSAELAAGVIIPLFKGGDETTFGNYRGITLIPIISKLFSMILENRLSHWTETRGIRARGQAGFRTNHRTTDQLFVLKTLIDKGKASKKHKKVYACFVDLRKAFDTVWRGKLWEVLRQIGITGRFLECIQTMYAVDSACVKTSEGLSETFRCNIGVRQGCPLSPLLFGIFMDELETRLDSVASDDPLRLGILAVKILMYADDIVLLARSAKDLQTYMDVLGTFCETRQLTVNTEKTKVLVFGSRQPHPNTFKIRGDAIEQVKSYKYLGLTMHQNRSWALALAERAQSARRAVFSLRKRCGEMHISDVGTTLQLFDALVKPVLSYGCELWVDSGGTAEL
jgi:hypothetical protein